MTSTSRTQAPFRSLRALATATFLLALLPGVASAASNTYCVSDTGCLFSGGIGEGSDLQKALDAAAAHPGQDSVSIGGGTFAAGPYTYSDSNPDNGVEITGAAGEQTTLSMPASKFATVLEVAGPESSVASLRLDLPPLADDSASELGLYLHGGAVANRLSVSSAGAQHFRGIYIDGGSLLDSTVALPKQDGTTAVLGKNATLTRDSLSAMLGLSIFDNSGTSSRGSRLAVDAVQAGAETECGSLTIDDSLIRTGAGGTGASAILAPVPACSHPSRVVLRQSTLLGGGADTGGVGVVSDASGEASARIENSIIQGFTHSLYRLSYTGTASISTTYSDYDTTTTKSVTQPGGSGAVTASHQVDVAPGFVDGVHGNFRLRTSSPLVNAGAPGGLLADEPGMDLAGANRVFGGRRDIGAYELQHAAALHIPHLRLAAPNRVHERRHARLVLAVRSDLPAHVQTTALVKIGGNKRRLRVREARTIVSAGRVRQVSLPVPYTRAIRLALTRGRRVVIEITAKATGSGLMPVSVRRSIRVIA